MAIRFDASADALSRTTNLPGIDSFTMTGWFYFSADRGATANCFAFGASSGSTYKQVMWDQTGAGSVLGLWNGANTVLGTTSLSLNTWYHIALVSGSANSNLVYLNGVQEINNTLAQSASAAKLWVGNDNDTEWLNGRAAAVKIYSVALTVAEIVQEMAQCQPVSFANLNGFYPLWSTSDDEIDFSGNANNWTVGGTLATEDGPPIPWKEIRTRVFLPTTNTYNEIASGGVVCGGRARITGGAQVATPNADISTGTWAVTPLNPKIDELNPDDTDLIASGSFPANDTCEVKLSGLTDPVTSVGHVVYYRYRKNATTRAVQLTVKLIQGTTEIANWTETLTTEWEEQQRTLSAAEANSITDYSDLRLRFIANQI